jgi:hypothetical protein
LVVFFVFADYRKFGRDVNISVALPPLHPVAHTQGTFGFGQSGAIRKIRFRVHLATEEILRVLSLNKNKV